TIQTERKSELARLIGGQMIDNDLVRGRGENLARIANAAAVELDVSRGRVEVQFAAIVGDGRGGMRVLKIQMQIAEDLVTAPLGAGGTWTLAGKVGVYQGFGLGVLAREQQAADFGQNFVGVWPVGVLRGTRPNGTLVEDHALVVNSAEHHGAETAIAERARGSEICRRSVEPDHGFRRGLGGEGGEQQGCDPGEEMFQGDQRMCPLKGRLFGARPAPEAKQRWRRPRRPQSRVGDDGGPILLDRWSKSGPHDRAASEPGTGAPR